MKYKAIISDVDGTLIPPSEYPAPKLPPKIVDVVIRVRQRGIYFSLATGRSLDWLEDLVDSLSLTEPIILDNGARIYDCGKRLYLSSIYLSREEVEKVLSIIIKDPTLRIFILEDERRLDSPDKIRTWKITKILVLGVTPAKANDLYQSLSQIPTISVTKSVSGIGVKSQSIHVTSGRATKQHGVMEVAKILGVSTKEIIGIGDSYNDYQLLMACGLKIAMGNAVAEIKEIADYIAPPYEQGGIIHVLEKFILSQNL
ncbi:HAD family phosphatase [Candidatus Gottesmanbacteria bacterium]|nr:HAD family phosphatase [Candidatus Gottesmanbacteria bacterium]